MKLGELFPDFSAETNEGAIASFHDWVGDSWAILFSHPADFTPVCTTELAMASHLSSEFSKRGVKMIALSCDSVDSHRRWIDDIVSYEHELCEGETASTGRPGAFPFPIISDERRVLANLLGMLDPAEVDAKGIPLTARAVFIIDPSKKLRLSLLYPASTGRNFTEILRAIDSLQLTDSKQVATPADWKPGDECMVLPTVSEDKVSTLFGEAVLRSAKMPSGKPYMRFVKLRDDT